MIAELKPHSNGLKTTNLVDVEVHHNGNGNLKELKNGHGHSEPIDEDEGAGKSLEIDDEPKSEHLESLSKSASNGTPTSGIVDDDDPFSDANDLHSPSIEHAKTEVKQIEDRHFDQFESKATARWPNLNEPYEAASESANNSTVDHSFNLTAATDITVDSIKEHFSNLNIRNDVDLLLDTNDGKL